MMGYRLLISLCLSVFFSTAGAESLKIAALFAKTGLNSYGGDINFRGVALAVAEINAQGGLLGRTVEVLELDTESTPLGAKKAAEEAIRQGVVAVIGSDLTAPSLTIAPLLDAAKIPMISNATSHPQLTLNRPFVFRVCFTDTLQGKAMAQFARESLQARTAVSLVNIGNQYSETLATVFAEHFRQVGGRMLWRGRYTDEDITYAELLQKTASLQPQVVYIPSYVRDSGLIIRQARRMGLTSIFLGGDGWAGKAIYEYGKIAAEGSFYTTHWHQDLSFPKSRALRRAYLRAYNQEIADDRVALAYDAMWVLADAVGRAQRVDAEALRVALLETNWEGATGQIQFDAEGDAMNKAVYMMKLLDGDIVHVETVRVED